VAGREVDVRAYNGRKRKPTPAHIRRGRKAEREELRKKIREVGEVLDGLEQMCDDGEIIFTGTGFKLAERVVGGLA
jgi:hypothetical protein